MFSGSIIRKLSRVEKFFAENEVFTSVAIRVRGGADVVDIDALSEAFDALVEAHPVLASRLEQGVDGSWNLVADDLRHPGIYIIDGTSAGNAETRLDQTTALFYSQLTIGDETSTLMMYIHHGIADAHHLGELFRELFTRYINVVNTGTPGPIIPESAPQPPEVVLEQRGIKKQGTAGIERYLPLMFAYELPPAEKPTSIAKPGSPQAVPIARVQLTKQETTDLVEFGRENQISVNTLVAAAILITEWRLRKTPHIPIPYAYPVDIRCLVNPPVRPTECTNLVGVATYLAEITPDTDILDLATDIGATFRADLADGLILKETLHLTGALQEAPAGMPPIVVYTDVSEIASETVGGLEVESQSQFFCSPAYSLDIYRCWTRGGQMVIERHCRTPEEEALEAIRTLVCSVPSEYGWVME